MEVIDSCYQTLRDMGIPQEDARAVLPNACATKLAFTVNMRELMHICNERLCTRAQNEIREVVKMMRDEVVTACPFTGDFLVPKCQKNKKYPFCTEQKCCGLSPRLKDVYNKVGG